MLVLGDLQYERGSLGRSRAADRSWGWFAGITYPTLGNHEWHVGGGRVLRLLGLEGAADRRPRSGFYSFDLGAWHLDLVGNSTCLVVCGEGGAQDTFLERDLERTAERVHHRDLAPSASSTRAPSTARRCSRTCGRSGTILFAGGADVVLNGHEHNYQRYAEQSPDGRATTRGIRQFVAGTGGRNLYDLLDRRTRTTKPARFGSGSSGCSSATPRTRGSSWVSTGPSSTAAAPRAAGDDGRAQAGAAPVPNPSVWRCATSSRMDPRDRRGGRGELRRVQPIRSRVDRLLHYRTAERAWRRGAFGGRVTGFWLDRLPEGWFVFHDVPVGARGANIDHLVVGPSGVFTVNTKDLTGAIASTRGRSRTTGIGRTSSRRRRPTSGRRPPVGGGGPTGRRPRGPRDPGRRVGDREGAGGRLRAGRGARRT